LASKDTCTRNKVIQFDSTLESATATFGNSNWKSLCYGGLCSLANFGAKLLRKEWKASISLFADIPRFRFWNAGHTGRERHI